MTRRTRRIIEAAAFTGLTLAALLPFVSFGSAGSADLGIRVAAETRKTITLAWTPQSGVAGYVFYVDGKRVSWTLNATRTTATFWKDSRSVEVRPMVLLPSGVWSSTARAQPDGAGGVRPFGANGDGPDIGLHIVSETSKTITLGWTPPAEAAGYLFYVDDARVSWTLDPTRAAVTFSKGSSRLEVRPVVFLPSSSWSSPLPPGNGEPAAQKDATPGPLPAAPTVPAPTPAQPAAAASAPAQPAAAAPAAAQPAAAAPAPAQPAAPAAVPAAPAPTSAPAPAVAGFSAPAWLVGLELNQTDTTGESGNRYTFGWIKSKRPSPAQPTGWADEGAIEFSDYPDQFVMVETKRFDQGYPGRTTNFHLVGNETAGGGVSPLSADYRAGRSPDWPADLQIGLVLTAEAELQDQRRGHWQLLTEAEITADRSVAWTLVWRIRWRADRTGSVVVSVLRNGQLVRTVDTGPIRTAYSGQQPRLFTWLGGYEPVGLSSIARVTQSLDYRGRTISEALADRPTLGSMVHSNSSGGSSDSSVSTTSPLVRPDAAIAALG